MKVIFCSIILQCLEKRNIHVCWFWSWYNLCWLSCCMLFLLQVVWHLFSGMLRVQSNLHNMMLRLWFWFSALLMIAILLICFKEDYCRPTSYECVVISHKSDHILLYFFVLLLFGLICAGLTKQPFSKMGFTWALYFL